MSAAEETPGDRFLGFWQRVGAEEQGTGCWPWNGALNEHGYGRFTYRRDDGRSLASRAHRIAYELLVGPIPDGAQLDHLCRNRRCVNPAHLEPVTAEVNSRRSSRYRGAGIERRQRDWRVVWRVKGKKHYQVFDTEAAAMAFVAEMYLRGVA